MLAGKTREDRQTLIIECDTFFSETRSLLAAELEAETAAEASRTSARAAENSGVAWNWEAWSGLAPQSPAQSPAEKTDEPSAPEVSSESSPGGINSTESPSLSSLISRVKNSYGTRLNAILNGG
jgi:hypothetical protein